MYRSHTPVLIVIHNTVPSPSNPLVGRAVPAMKALQLCNRCPNIAGAARSLRSRCASNFPRSHALRSSLYTSHCESIWNCPSRRSGPRPRHWGNDYTVVMSSSRAWPTPTMVNIDQGIHTVVYNDERSVWERGNVLDKSALTITVIRFIKRNRSSKPQSVP